MFCFSNLEVALIDAEFVIEAVQEEIEAKRSLFEGTNCENTWISNFKCISYSITVASKTCKSSVILATSSLRLSLDEVFDCSKNREVISINV